MKPIFRIAKLELNILFYSPIAWFLLVVFLVQCGFIYTDMLQMIVTTQQIDGVKGGSLTNYLFNYPYGGVFPSVGSYLYLYLPLLTMGLISRETGSGTIKLLYSSPVKVRDIVFGKFVAMMGYNLLLAGVVGLFVLSGILFIPRVDTGLVLSGLLSLYLLLCAYAAIGLFMSCLTTYQMVAAICTLFLFFLLSSIGGIGQDIDIVRDLTHFLSIAGRARKMSGGLIKTKDILYFVVIVYLFLGFSITKLKSGMESRPFRRRAGRYALILVSGLLAGYLFSLPRLTGYYDATATKVRTLTPKTRNILAATGNEPLEVISYINLLDDYYMLGAPDKRNLDMERWEPFLRFKPGIKFEYVYYYDSASNPALYSNHPGQGLKQIAEKLAKIHHVKLKKFMTPAEIHQLIDLRPEANRYVMQLRYKGRQTWLRLYDDAQHFPGETEVAAALQRLMIPLPKIAFLQGGFERSPFKMGDRNYGMITTRKQFRWALINQGFDVDSISLERREIPADLAALVIADPRTEPDSVTMQKIWRYIDRGGNLLICGEPGKQEILNPLLRPLGVQLMTGQLLQHNRRAAANVVLTRVTAAALDLSSDMKMVEEHEEPVVMPVAAALSYTGYGPFTIRPMLLSNMSGWITKTPPVLDSAEIFYTSASGDVRGSFPTALQLTRAVNGREQRIVVTGDADFMSNQELNRKNIITGNFNFSTALFAWFANGDFPIDTSRPDPADNVLNLTDKKLVYMKLFFRWFLPGLVLISGTVLLLRRKRK